MMRAAGICSRTVATIRVIGSMHHLPNSPAGNIADISWKKKKRQ